MFYRMRIYESVRENLPLFHDFFLAQLSNTFRAVSRSRVDLASRRGQLVARPASSQSFRPGPDGCLYALIRWPRQPAGTAITVAARLYSTYSQRASGWPS